VGARLQARLQEALRAAPEIPQGETIGRSTGAGTWYLDCQLNGFHCGSGMFMPVLGSRIRILPSRIPDPGSKNSGYRIRILVKEFKVFLTQKIVAKLSEIWIRDEHPGSGS
jgi:hypothetical protein